MKILTAAEARALDARVMGEYGIAEATLMKTAGTAVARILAERTDVRGEKICVVCGTGNNGGDGFVCAKRLQKIGAKFCVLVFGNADHMGESAKKFRRAAEKAGIPVSEITTAAEAETALSEADTIIDALIGTGLTSGVAGEKAELIEMINAAEKSVVSVDVPSGMSADSGEISGACVHANVTVALGTPKRCHILSPAEECCGEIVVEDIGMPEEAREDFPVSVVLECDAARGIPTRGRLSHKGENGFIGIIAGSADMSGAALLSAQGALRAGAGKVALLTPGAAARQLAGRIPEIMVRGVSDENFFTETSADGVLSATEAYDAIVLGPGLGRRPETMNFTQTILKRLAKPIVLDADALFAIAERRVSLKDMPGQYILTPHVGEFSRLTGISAKDVERARIEAAVSYAKEINSIVVLKGVPTVTADPSGAAWLNTTGNPGMATGGMGDTLTGIIAALIGQGAALLSAAYAGVYWHGAAGNLAAIDGPIGYTASELAGKLPLARELIAGRRE